jgi:serine/threonine-protein kinase
VVTEGGTGQRGDPARIGHFRVVSRLGHGGMGIVYRAEDEKLRRTVALKVLPREFAEDPERRRRFLREARSAAALTHPNIATVYEVGEDDGRIYIAMELVEGESLRARIARGPLAADEALRLAHGMARGLARAHARGVVHRDLKPENVVVDRDGDPKILDFGLAKIEPSGGEGGGSEASETASLLTEEGRLLGTPMYMSPEQALGSPVDARSDVFSMGVVLYEMCAGKRPFDGPTARHVLVAISRDEPKPLREAAPDAPEELASVVARCLAKKAEDRFANGQALLEAIDGSAPSGARSSKSGPTAKSAKSGDAAPARTGRTTTVAALAAVAAVAVGGAWWARSTATASQAPAPAPPATSAAPAASSSAAARAITRIVDLPPPKTSVPEAGTEYELGVRALYDNTWLIAAVHFMKAIALDPSMAEAHLRLSEVVVVTRLPLLRRAEFQKAAGLREHMSPRDQEMMEALQPFLQADPQDVAEAERRLRAFAERHPDDAEPFMWLGACHYWDPVAGLAYAERALSLDPDDPLQWELKADALASAGKFDEARAAYEQCNSHSIDGAECWAIRSLSDRHARRCADEEQDARKAGDRNPFWLGILIAAMANNGATPEAIQERIAQFIAALLPPLGPEVQRLGLQARMAIVAGDFARASELAKQEAAAIDADPNLRAAHWIQAQAAMHRLEAAIESGDTAGMQRMASDFVARSSGWPSEMTLGHRVDLSLQVARLALPPGEPAPASFEQARHKWIDERFFAGAWKGDVWNYGYAATAFTPAEARAALDALGELGPPSPVPSFAAWGFSARWGSPDADIGRVYLLAGRVDEAVAHLKLATAECNLFDSTIDHVHARLDLGRALEQKGDTAGACEAYRKVLAVWGHAKPRSVSADAARARVTSLKCPAR